jgi:phosphoribosylaminoimidazole-succinocarboxamide synthase
MVGIFNRRKVVYEGKAKIIYEGTEPGTFIQYFKDDATAYTGQPGAKKTTISGKGVLNNRISAHIMTKLEGIGVPTHFLRSLNMREQLVRQVEMIPIEIVVRNIAAGSFCKRFGMKEGTILPNPVVEFYFKKDELGDPMINENHIYTFGWADPFEIEEMVGQSYRVNDYLNGMFAGIGLKLVDFKLEFGRLWGEYDELYIILADEISPDNCRLWDANTGEKLDKDRFRQDLGNVMEGYQEIAKRLGLIPQGGIFSDGSFDEKLAEGLSEIENELARERRLRAVNKTPPKTRV